VKIADLDPSFPIETVTTGNAFAIVPVRSLAAIRELSLEWRHAAEYLKNTDAHFFYFVTRDTESAARLHARMIFYGGEDPATGSAAGCAISYLVGHGIVPPQHQIHVQQGVEIGRASDLFLTADLVCGKVASVRVSGSTVPVAKGQLFLP